MKVLGITLSAKILAAIGAVVVVAGGAAFFLSGRSPAKTGKNEWEFATVEKGDVLRNITASGTVQPIDQVDIGSQVSGKIVEVLVDFNTPVKKNQILAKIDPESFRSAVASAEARVLQARATVANSQSSIERSQVALELAQSNYDRNKRLYAEKAISQAAWEQSDRDFKVAKVQLDTDRSSLKSAEAGLAQSQAQLEDARTNLERTNIRSSVDGVVLNKQVNVGQTVQSSMSVAKLFTVAQDLSQIQIEASVVEGDIGGIDPGDPVAFEVDAQKGRRFQGSVRQVRKLGTEQANVVTYTVVVQAANPGNVLLPGMTANVDITADRASNVLRIAAEATQFKPPKEILDQIEKRSGGQQGGQRQGGQGQGGQGQGGGAGAPGANNAQIASFGGGAGGGQRGEGNRGAGGAGGFGGARGGGGGSPDMLKEIGVSDDKIKAIQTEMQAEMEKMRASMMQGQRPAGAGGNAIVGGGGGFGMPQDMVQRQQMQERMQKMQRTMEDIMKRNLTPEQFEAYAAKRAEMQTQKRATVYRVNDKGEVERHPIVIGVSDGNYGEIIRGAKEGDKFILRLKPQPQPKK